MSKFKCGICQQPGAEVMCIDCHTPHHFDCWNFNKSCGVYACPGDEFRSAVDLAEPVVDLVVVADEGEESFSHTQVVVAEAVGLTVIVGASCGVLVLSGVALATFFPGLFVTLGPVLSVFVRSLRILAPAALVVCASLIFYYVMVYFSNQDSRRLR